MLLADGRYKSSHALWRKLAFLDPSYARLYANSLLSTFTSFSFLFKLTEIISLIKCFAHVFLDVFAAVCNVLMTS